MKRLLFSALALGLFALPLHARFIEHKERHLGPTGLFGVTSPQEIRITKVAEGSPADGRIDVGDVIVKAGGMGFERGTRRTLARAIDEAEAPGGKGKLVLGLKDSREVTLDLPVLGAFSERAPYDCPKTDAMITRAADFITAHKKYGRADMRIGLLGLLATGEQARIEAVKEEIHRAKWADPSLKLSLDTYARTAWSWGYLNLLLTEYYLLTGDEHVLPAITAYSVAIAKGRDAAGLWGHGMATYDLNDGQPNGRLPGYAVMNQSSLPCFVSLILARKCGIGHPEIEAAIAHTRTFYESFIGEGTLPYGVHDPNPKSYNNNGMSGLAAVAFSLLQDREGAAFFSRMSLASHQTMETGHTGHYFNQLWTGLGANLAGPEAAVAFHREARWLHTLNRTWEGDFTYDCSGYPQPIYSYRGLSDAGSHLLNLCLGRKALQITGRDADPTIFPSPEEVAEITGLATLDPRQASDRELLEKFGHPMPKIRLEAVWTLREREHGLTGEIRGLIRQGGLRERESAISYFGYGCPKEVALAAREDLLHVLRDEAEDPGLREAAAAALSHLGSEAHLAYRDILRLVLAEKPGDPLGILDMRLGKSLNTLCANPFEAGLVEDKELFYAAAEKLLDNRRANGRTEGVKLVAHMPIEDFHRVGDRIAGILEDRNLSYHSYHNLGPMQQAMILLAELNIEGGIEAAFAILDRDTGKFGFKVRMLMEVLPKYGAHAKPHLRRLREMKVGGRFEKPWHAMLESIEKAPPAKPMIPIEEAKKVGSR